MKVQRLREQRERKGLTQAELATRAGLNVASVVRAEGGGDVRVTNARRYAHALDLTVGDLVEEPGQDLIELDQEAVREIVRAHRAGKLSREEAARAIKDLSLSVDDAVDLLLDYADRERSYEQERT